MPHDTLNPYVPAGVRLRELSLKAVVLGALLSAVMAGANAYLGLFAGMTVSASIPAAVLSMALLRPLHGTVLENNIVQTATSAGESLAAGAVFTLPALVLLGAWAGFAYLETTLIVGLGGVLGVLFTVPLRRAFILEQPLRYPEGLATAEVLKIGDRGAGAAVLALSAGLGGLFKLGNAGLRLWHGMIEHAWYVRSSIAYVGINLSPALLAVGYIVGLNIATLVFVGGALNWLVAIPILAAVRGTPPDSSALQTASALWSEQTRYIGVGAMLVGGFWALVELRRSLLRGIRSGLAAYRTGTSHSKPRSRADRDLPMQWVLGSALASIIPLFLLFWHLSGIWWIAAVMAVLMLAAGFLFSAVAAYMAGLVGSSSNPISGVTIATIVTSALMLTALLGTDSKLGPASAIMIGAVVCCAAAIAGDNLQDLKAGHLVGATPYRQQIMQLVGVLSAAVVIAPVLSLLQQAYGIGMATEAHPNPLRAPQASLMASVADGVFRADLPWAMVAIGMALATIVIVIDRQLQARGSRFRTPVLAVAVGVYLPFELAVPILLGGLVAFAAARRRVGGASLPPSSRDVALKRRGLLFGAGLITGEALMGILLAVPIVISGSPDVLLITAPSPRHWPAALLFAGIVFGLFRVATKPRIS